MAEPARTQTVLLRQLHGVVHMLAYEPDDLAGQVEQGKRPGTQPRLASMRCRGRREGADPLVSVVTTIPGHAVRLVGPTAARATDADADADASANA